ncbi:hypothetical protein HA378_31950, partial [Escherichia coli]|nr:hypothetical protein [Escherichia coli]
KAPGRIFQITTEEAKARLDVVSGIFLVSNLPANVLFDSGATMSFVSTKFCVQFDVKPVRLEHNLEVEIADGSTTLVESVFEDCLIS